MFYVHDFWIFFHLYLEMWNTASERNSLQGNWRDHRQEEKRKTGKRIKIYKNIVLTGVDSVKPNGLSTTYTVIDCVVCV